MKKWISIDEDFEIYQTNNTMDFINRFEDYKKSQGLIKTKNI